MCYKNNTVTPPGLEPRLTVPKTGVLPLHHGAIHGFVINGTQRYVKKFFQENFFVKKIRGQRSEHFVVRSQMNIYYDEVEKIQEFSLLRPMSDSNAF